MNVYLFLKGRWGFPMGIVTDLSSDYENQSSLLKKKTRRYKFIFSAMVVLFFFALLIFILQLTMDILQGGDDWLFISKMFGFTTAFVLFYTLVMGYILKLILGIEKLQKENNVQQLISNACGDNPKRILSKQWEVLNIYALIDLHIKDATLILQNLIEESKLKLGHRHRFVHALEDLLSVANDKM